MKKNQRLSYYKKEFLKSVKEERSLSTLDNYRRVLNRLEVAVNDPILKELTEEKINNDFLAYLQVKKLSKFTVYQSFLIVGVFLSFLRLNGATKLNPDLLLTKKLFQDSTVRRHVYEHTLDDILDKNELNKLKAYWDTTEYHNNPRGIRNYLLIILMSDFGLSVSELKLLMRENFNAKTRKLKLQRRGSTRELFLSDKAARLISWYLERRDDKCPAIFAAFKVSDEYIVQAWPLTERSMERIVKQTATDLGLEGRVNPSAFRNSYIYHRLNEGAERKDLIKELGFSKTSSRYLRILHLVDPKYSPK